MKIQYRSVTGINEIEVDEEWGNRILEFNRADYNSERKDHRSDRKCNGMESEACTGLKSRNGWFYTDSVLEDIIRAEDYSHLLKAVDKLPADQRDLVNAVFFNDVKAVDYARSMGISKAAVSQRLDRALSNLKKIFLQTR